MPLSIRPLLSALFDIDWTTAGANKLLAQITSSGKAYSFTGAPTVSGANITAATVPNAALVTTPALISALPWTPSDNSGAGLTFSSVAGKYCTVGVPGGPHTVWFTAAFTYPVTVSSATAQINLPYAIGADGYNQVIPIGYNTLGTSISIIISNGTALFTTVAGANLTNANLSTAGLIFTGTYESPT